MSDRLLYNELQNKSPEMAKELDAICDAALDIWKEQRLSSFTAHGKDHIEQVEKNLDALTRNLQGGTNKLEPEEIFVLLAACYVHDIAMQLDRPDARQHHAQYIYDLIMEGTRLSLPIPGRKTRRAVATIAKAHWTEFALLLYKTDYIYNNMIGRLRILGLLLAMADLLDISPLRARYYRSNHNLAALDPQAELHQMMHHFAAYDISPANPLIPNKLQFQLEWDDNSIEMREVSGWVMHWFTSQWQPLSLDLFEESNGTIDWHKQWAKITFRSGGSPFKLSEEARRVLNAEQKEQARINREEIVSRFHDVFANGESAVIVLPMYDASDAVIIGKWYEAQALVKKNCTVAKVDIPSDREPTIGDIAVQLMEQWDGPTPAFSDARALKHLKAFLEDQSRHFVSLIYVGAYNCAFLSPLLSTLTQQSRGVAWARLCIVLTNDIDRMVALRVPTAEVYDLPPYTEKEVDMYLQEKWGYSKEQSQEVVTNMTEHFADLNSIQHPAFVHNYIKRECKRLVASSEK